MQRRANYHSRHRHLNRITCQVIKNDDTAQREINQMVVEAEASELLRKFRDQKHRMDE